MSGILLQLTVGTDTVAQAATAASQEVDTMNLWGLVQKGGWIMVPIVLLSLITIYIFFERLFVLRRASSGPGDLVLNVRDQIQNGNIQGALVLCKGNTSPEARMIEKGINRIGIPIKEIESAMENVGKKEMDKLEKNIGVLAVIAGIAPMFGFIGTITGVIRIFYNISLADNISIGLIAGGLYEKMITSASGLTVGILAFILYHTLNFMVERISRRMEGNAFDFIDMLHEPGK
jgi:biopolymer transport protein ExbB